MKLMIGQDTLFTGFPLPDDRRLVVARGVEMAVKAVIGRIDLPSDKPLGKGNFPIQNLAPFFEPVKFLRLTRPEGIGSAD